MGLFDSDSQTSGADGAAGSQTNQGDAVTVGLTAGSDIGSNATINTSVSRTNYVTETNVITEVDAGAVEAAFDFAGGVAAVIGDAGDSVIDASRQFAELTRAGQRDAFALAGDFGARSERLSADVIGFTGDELDATRGFARSLVGETVDAVARQADNAIDATTAALREINRDGNERITEQVVKVAGLVAGVALLVTIVPAVVRR